MLQQWHWRCQGSGSSAAVAADAAGAVVYRKVDD